MTISQENVKKDDKIVIFQPVGHKMHKKNFPISLLDFLQKMGDNLSEN